MPIKISVDKRQNAKLKHGHARRDLNGKPGASRIYSVWAALVQRCENPLNHAHPKYGGRGIQLCTKWRSFIGFLDDMGEGKKGWTLERFDNSSGYNIWNCVWALPIVQARNMRTNVVITVRGTTGCIVELCEKFHANYELVRHRIASGWEPEKAMFHTKRPYNRKLLP